MPPDQRPRARQGPRRLRITFVCGVFPPEPEPSAVMGGELARRWARDGHDVLVICPFPNRPGGEVYPGHRRRPWRRDAIDGARLLRVWTWLVGRRRRTLDRLLENLSFGLGSALALLFARRPHVVLLESWPLIASALGVFACRLRRVPVINYVKDVYPDAAIAAGMLAEGSAAVRALTGLDAWICRKATLNVVISQGVATSLAGSRRVPAERFAVIPDWLDLSRFEGAEHQRGWRREMGFTDDELLCMFAGTMGHVSRVDVLVEVAELLREVEGLRIVCVGQGVLKEPMQRAIADRGLDNLTLLPFQPHERVPEMQASADLLLLTSSREMGFSSVPNKLITYLAAGRPVVCAISAGSDSAMLIEEHDLGLVVPAESPDGIARAILELKEAGPARRAKIGVAARRVAAERFSLESAVASFYRQFHRLLA